MDRIKNLYVILIAMLFVGCSSDEPYYDRSSIAPMYILQIEDGALHQIEGDSLSVITTDANVGKVDVIKKFRDVYYMLSSEDSKILVMDAKTDSILANVACQSAPVDICFPNATDGYIIGNGNQPNISILDLTTNTLSGITIPLPYECSHLAAYGNQVYITCPDNDMVYVADTRSNTIVDSISITGRPTFIAATLDGEFFVVISIGNGKTETNSINPTAATLTTIETATRKISVSYDIGGSEKTATNIYPTGLAISDKNVYISSINLSGSGNAAWRTNTRTFRSFVSMSKQPTSFIGYAPVSETAYLLEETEIPQLVLFNSNNDKIATIALPNKVRAICGR